jgi:hypothetical protein
MFSKIIITVHSSYENIMHYILYGAVRIAACSAFPAIMDLRGAGSVANAWSSPQWCNYFPSPPLSHLLPALYWPSAWPSYNSFPSPRSRSQRFLSFPLLRARTIYPLPVLPPLLGSGYSTPGNFSKFQVVLFQVFKVF